MSIVIVKKCEFCGSVANLVFKSDTEAKNYLENWAIFDACLICSLIEKINLNIREVLLAINCLFYGKYIFTISEDDEISKLLYNNFRQKRKAIQSIYLELDETLLKTGYNLLGAAIETCCNTIVNALEKQGSGKHQIGRDYMVHKNYPKVMKLASINFKRLLPEKIEDIIPKKPRFTNAVAFIWYVNNVIKHQNSFIQNKGSGKKLIKKYKLRENEEFYSYSHCEIYKVRPAVQVNDISTLAGMLNVYLSDIIFQIFSAPKVRVSKLDIDNLYTMSLNVAFKQDLIKAIEKSLEKDAIYHCIKR